ncbi:proton channel OtopLc-like [Athalia rosae]|uniref:proton channel OtopLc-like n=1 Tax=Athalia rosae TaxID=37344 RepID=UPI002034185D|nr:proton channel OtopLc-like [Athalia rosae]
MVLQLVQPQGALRGIQEEPQDSVRNFSPVTDPTAHEYYAYTPSVISFGDANKSRNDDLDPAKSPGSDREFHSSVSLHSEVTSSHGTYPPPSSSEEKSHLFRSFFAIISSCVYAVFLVPFGLVIYIADLLIVDSSLAAGFNLYLVVVGFVYLIYLFFDIRLYVGKAERYLKATTNYDKEDDDNSANLPNEKIESEPDHGFCFTQGRHAGSIYLRVGAAVFCFGHLIHSGLLLLYEIVFLTTEEFYQCFNPISLTFDIMYPIYSFFQLFFIFKYSNVIINHCKEVARFFIMHTIASSLCFWIWAIFRESTDLLARHRANAEAAVITTEASVSRTISTSSAGVASDLRTILELLNGTSFNAECQHAELNVIIQKISPYLYPFTIEYSILIVGVLYMIWSNIGNCQRVDGGSSVQEVPCPPVAGPSAGSNIIVYADCRHANRGFFAGLLALVGSIVSIIIFFIAFAEPNHSGIGETMNEITNLALLVIMSFAAIIAYRQIIKLDVNHHPVSLLDDILLFIALPAFFLHALFSVLPAAQKRDWLRIVGIIFGLIQVLIQTPLIIDGLRRCANAKKLRSKRPGRELITFLIMCNVALWIGETFEIKSTEKEDDRYDFYGLQLWTILKHLTIPLTMFYRFHSSVCLADIWKSAYEPASSGP